jgi:hypothetical protein
VKDSTQVPWEQVHCPFLLRKLIDKGPQSKQSPIATHNEHFPVEVLRTYQGRNFHHLSLTTQRLVLVRQRLHLSSRKIIEMDVCKMQLLNLLNINFSGHNEPRCSGQTLVWPGPSPGFAA